jgi:hypothetical protein
MSAEMMSFSQFEASAPETTTLRQKERSAEAFPAASMETSSARVIFVRIAALQNRLSKYHLYFCGPGGGGGNFFGRTEDWKTFDLIVIHDPVIGGGDCDIKVGPTGTVFEADLQIFGSAIHRSYDDGKTFPDSYLYEEPVEEDR